MAVTLNASNSGTGGLSVTSDATGNLAFQTAGTTAVTVDTSQNVGIGTTSPSVKLQVDAGSAGEVQRYNTTSTAPYVGWYVSGTRKAYQQWDASYGWILDSEAASTGIVFRTQNTERMRIDSSGNLLVKKTSVNSTVDNNVGVQLAANGKCIIEVSGDRALILNRLNDNGIIQEFFRGAGNQVGNINAATSSVAYNTSSDYRLKKDIAPMTGALAKVAQLKPVTYKWKVDGEEGQGFIAHELQEVVPDCVTGAKDATQEQEYEVTPAVKDEQGNITTPAVMGTRTVPSYQGIDTSFLVATLTAAIQELKAINDTQAETITALTARIVALEK